MINETNNLIVNISVLALFKFFFYNICEIETGFLKLRLCFIISMCIKFNGPGEEWWGDFKDVFIKTKQHFALWLLVNKNKNNKKSRESQIYMKF